MRLRQNVGDRTKAGARRRVPCRGGAVLAGLFVALTPAGAAAAEWLVVALNDAAPVAAPSVQFATGGGFSGTTGCNRFQGSARLEDGGLVIDGPVATTRMACPGEAMTQQDDTIIAFFNGRIAVAFDPLRDVLRLTKGDIALDLARAVGADTALPDLPETHAGREAPTGTPPI